MNEAIGSWPIRNLWPNVTSFPCQINTIANPERIINNSKILKDENNTRYLNRVEYPVIPIQDSDTIIRGQFGKTFSNLAFEAYGKTELWWIIARANNENRGSMYVVPCKEYRVPEEIGLILQQFKELNK